MLLVDLTPLADGGRNSLLSGKERGIAMRQEFRLDELEAAGQPITVRIPDSIDTVTPSFITGMLTQSIRRAGSVDRFMELYHFEAHQGVIDQIRDIAAVALVQRTGMDRLVS